GGCGAGGGDCAVVVAERTSATLRDCARRRGDGPAVARVRIRLRPLSGGILWRLCEDLCGPGLRHGGARVPVLDGRNFRLWRRVESSDPPGQAEQRVARGRRGEALGMSCVTGADRRAFAHTTMFPRPAPPP